MNEKIKQLVESGEQSAQIVDIGPGEAAYLLGLNTRNRKLSAATVSRLSRTMAGGRWVPAVSNVAVGSDGALVNGQHTLTAIATTGMTVGVTLTVGIDPDARAVFDTGNRRSLAGTLDILGKSSTVNLASSAQLARRYEELAAAGRAVSSLTSRLVNYDPLEMVDWIEDLGEHGPRAVRMAKAEYGALGGNVKPSAIGGFYILALREDAGAAEAAHEAMVHGVGLFPGDPRLALRNWAMNAERKRDGAGKQLATMAKAWRRSLDGGEMRMAHLRTNEVLTPIG